MSERQRENHKSGREEKNGGMAGEGERGSVCVCETERPWNMTDSREETVTQLSVAAKNSPLVKMCKREVEATEENSTITIGEKLHCHVHALCFVGGVSLSRCT